MLSDTQILEYIKKFSQTSHGKQEIQKVYKGKFVPKYTTDGAKPMTIKQMKQIGEEMKKILFYEISKLIESFKYDDIIVSKPTFIGDSYMINISFDEQALKRESLDPSTYQGVDNIVKLFVHGYDAGGSVRGVWKGHGSDVIWSLRKREPDDFMDDATNIFNKQYKGIAHAELLKEYKNNI